MTLSIIKAQPTAIIKIDPNAGSAKLLLAYFLMFARAPRRAEPDVEGFYDLLEIGTVPDKNWTKATPYSVAEKE